MSKPADVLKLIHHEAEITTLAAMRHDMSTAVILAAELDATDFYDERRQVVFEAIVNLLRGIEPIDTAAIVAECLHVTETRKSKVMIAAEFVESLSGKTDQAVAYAHTVKRMAWLRQAGDFAFWLVRELQAHPEPDALYAEAQERWQTLAPKRENADFLYGWDTLKRHREVRRQRAEEREEGTAVRYDWPWASWNAVIRPLRAGMVGILAAPDGVGKTSYLEMIAEHWATKGIHVVYVHLEDEQMYKLDRRLARHARVDISRIEDACLSEEEDAKVFAAESRMGTWADRLHYYDASGKSMQVIVRELESRVAEGVCHAVVLDYLDKVQATRAQAKLFGSNSWERQADDMELLKTFAERNKLPVFTATQGNKDMQGEGTQTRKNIQGSGQKSQKAQLVVILTRDLVGDKGLRDANGALLADAGEYSPIANIRIDKQNRGKTGGFKQFFVGQHFSVRDIDRRKETA